MRSYELEAFLRQYEPLKEVRVGYSSEEAEAIAPWIMQVSGLILINGEMKAYETEVDSRHFQNAEDVHRLVKGLLESFEQASRQVA